MEQTNNPYDFDEVEELSFLLARDELLDIEEVLEETAPRKKYSYMNDPVRLTRPDGIEGHPDVDLFIEQVNGMRLARLNWAGQRKARGHAQQGDLQALTELVITGIPWVWRIAARYGKANPGEFLDYFQEGILGLIKAIRRWDPEKGHLATYGATWIMQRIERYIVNAGSPLRHPVHVQEKRKKVIEEIEATGRISPEIKSQDLAAWLPPVSLNSDLGKLLRSSIEEQALNQLEDPLLSDEYFFEDIPDNRTYEEEVIEKTYLDGVREWFFNAKLNERETFVLAHRYGLSPDGQAKTLEEVGALLGVTRERVRQIEAKAIRKLKHPTWLSVIKIDGKPRKTGGHEQSYKLSFHYERGHRGQPKPSGPLAWPQSESTTVQFRPRLQPLPNVRQTTESQTGKIVAEGKPEYTYDRCRHHISSEDIPTHLVVDVLDVFCDIFGLIPSSEDEIFLLLDAAERNKILRCWHRLLKMEPVREVLTRKQLTVIEGFMNGECGLDIRVMGLMKRALMRIHRKFLSYEQWKARLNDLSGG